MTMTKRDGVGEQLELGATAKGSVKGSVTQPRDAWVDMIEKEFGLILMPLIDKSYSVTMCREVATRLAVLAAKRARAASALSEMVVRCAGCDTEVDVKSGISLCGRCGEGFRSAGSDG